MTNHLWQSSCFALLAALLAFALRTGPAKARYWVWLSASLKFLLPLALLMSVGSRIPSPTAAVMPAAPAILQIAEPFTPATYLPTPSKTKTDWTPTSIGIVWALGFIAIGSVRFRSWLRIQSALRAARPIELPIPIPVVVADHVTEPGVVGFFRPVLVLPPRLLDHLNERQLNALLTHEMCHVRRRDNLFSAIHMLVETIFWFNPLVWWIGAHLVEERERACDEEVLQLGCEPADYVEGILQVCRLYRESPLQCVSGVSGADVKKRIRSILSGSIARDWSLGRKAALAGVAVAVVAAPLIIGMLNAPAIRAQDATTLKFEVASIRPAEFPSDAFAAGFRAAARSSPCTQGDLKVSGTLVSLTKVGICDLIRLAYGLRSYQVVGVPARLGLSAEERLEPSAGGIRESIQQRIAAISKEPNPFYDIEARAAGSEAPNDEQTRAMLQALLAERFHLAAHNETREISYLALVQAKGGAKLQPASESCKPHSSLSLMAPCAQTMEQVARYLNSYADRQVIDMTGLTGKYDYEVPTDRTAPDFGADVTAAIQQRLGLRLEPRKGPIEVLVVDHVETPSEN